MSFCMRILTVLGLGAAFLSGTDSAQAGRTFMTAGFRSTGASSSHTVRGVVVHVQHHKGGSGASITVKIHHRHKTSVASSSAARTSERVFRIGQNTQVWHHGKSAGLGAVHKGEHVIIHTVAGHRHEAGKIQILSGNKKNP